MRNLLKKVIRSWVSFLKGSAESSMTRAMVWSIRSGSRKEFKHRRCAMSPEQVQAVKAYWKTYTSKNRPFFQGLYTCMHGRFDVRYLPDDLYLTRILPHLNDRDYAILTHKGLQPLLFDCRQPRTLFMVMGGHYYDASYRVITRDQALARFLEEGRGVFKPSTRTHSGRGIQFFQTGSAGELSDFLDLHFADLPDYVVQEVVEQHPALAAIHQSSVNCVRIMTLLVDGRAVSVSSVLKMGAGGSQVDNLGFGGIVCGIKEDGSLRDVAFAANGDPYSKHPQGFDFAGFLVPSFEKVKEMAQEMAERIPHTRLIAWDIAVGRDGEPILIEYNDIGELGFMQYASGPLLGDLTDRILQEVFL